MHRYTVKVLYRSKPYSMDEFKLQRESCNFGIYQYNFHFLRSVKLDFMHSLIVFAVDDRIKDSIEALISRNGGTIQFDCLKDGYKKKKIVMFDVMPPKYSKYVKYFSLYYAILFLLSSRK